ncbi:MAG: DUF4175 family protein [Bacteroidetes bacterium]|nr:DUF4175 family protein [Bacteroidota bacterium]
MLNTFFMLGHVVSNTFVYSRNQHPILSNSTDYNLLIQKLDAFIRKYYWNRILKGSIQFVALLVASFLLVNSIEYFAQSSTTARTIMFFAYLILVLSALASWIIIPALKLAKIGSVISHQQAATIIGNHFGNVADKLLNTLQLQNNQTGGSSTLIEASINQKISELKPVPFNLAIDLKKNRKYLKYAIIPLVVLAVLLIKMPDVVLKSSARIISYNQEFAKEAPFTFQLNNQKLSVLMHQDFEIDLSIVGSVVPENVFVFVNGTEYRMTADNKTNFKYSIKKIDATKQIQFSAAGFESIPYTIEVLPRPFLKGFEVVLDYPSYTGKKPETIKNIGDITIPQGSIITWKFNTENTEEIAFGFADTNTLAKRKTETEFQLTKAFSQSQAYTIKSSNQHTTADSIRYDINVVPDARPSISVEMAQDSTSLKTYFFQGRISDDYGISFLQFKYRITKSENPQKVMSQYASQSIATSTKSLQTFFHYWDLNKLGYESGDELECYFEVWDNDGVNGKKSSKSQVFTLKAPSKKEINEMVAESSNEIKDDMQALMKEAQKIQTELEDVRNRMMNKKQMDWEDKQALSNLLEKQQKLEERLEKMNEKYKDMIKQQDEFNEMDEKIREKHQLLQELFEKMMTEEMKEMYEELQKMLQENQQDVQEELDEMEMNNEELEKELDIALEHFKQLELEQKLEETIEKLEELEEKQNELNEKTEEGKQNEEQLKQQQDALNREFDDIKKDIDDLEKKNSELEQPNKMENTEQEQQDIEQNMQESSENLEKKKSNKASQSQKKASEKMKELKEKMQEMQSQMQQENQQEDLQSLRQILENLMHLSFEQEKLIDELKELNGYNPKFVEIAQRQIQLQNDAKIIEDSLTALAKRVIQISSFINKEVNEMNYNMEKTLDNMSVRNIPQSRKYQQHTMTHVNNLAVMLSEVMDQMQQQMAQQQPGQQQCENPKQQGKGQKPQQGNSKQLGNMRQMQEQLGKQLGEMKEKMGKGQRPLSKELAKMAAQQQALRRAIQEMNESKEAGGDKPSKELQELQELMDKNEEDLVNKRITNELLERQHNIVTRLLEAEEAEREQEFSNERESNTAQEINDPSKKAFEAYKKARMKEIELLNAVPTELNNYYKERVKEYFESIQD